MTGATASNGISLWCVQWRWMAEPPLRARNASPMQRVARGAWVPCRSPLNFGASAFRVSLCVVLVLLCQLPGLAVGSVPPAVADALGSAPVPLWLEALATRADIVKVATLLPRQGASMVRVAARCLGLLLRAWRRAKVQKASEESARGHGSIRCPGILISGYVPDGAARQWCG